MTIYCEDEDLFFQQASCCFKFIVIRNKFMDDCLLIKHSALNFVNIQVPINLKPFYYLITAKSLAIIVQKNQVLSSVVSTLPCTALIGSLTLKSLYNSRFSLFLGFPFPFQRLNFWGFWCSFWSSLSQGSKIILF